MAINLLNAIPKLRGINFKLNTLTTLDLSIMTVSAETSFETDRIDSFSFRFDKLSNLGRICHLLKASIVSKLL